MAKISREKKWARREFESLTLMSIAQFSGERFFDQDRALAQLSPYYRTVADIVLGNPVGEMTESQREMAKNLLEAVGRRAKILEEIARERGAPRHAADASPSCTAG